MSHLPTLIADLALILISASIITLLFKWLKQPLVLGYIIAGLLAGRQSKLASVTLGVGLFIITFLIDNMFPSIKRWKQYNK